MDVEPQVRPVVDGEVVRVDALRAIGLFDGLTDAQLAELAAAGAEVRITPGVELFREGEHADFWWVLVEGAVDLLRRVGREDAVVGRMDVPGRWAGGFRAWDQHGVYLATGRGALDGWLLRVPAAVLRDRTNAWFPFGAHLVEGVYGTARAIESTARQNASLLTLGTLAAGLAHEINNPAAAATRASTALEDACGALLASVARLVESGVSAARFTALDALRREIRPPGEALGALAMADHEDALSSWLVEHDVDRDWVIAPALAAAGADLAWCERAAAALPGPALEPGLEWVANTLSVAALLTEVQDATRRVSGLVTAMKSYSQMDRASLQEVDVAEGVESTLVVLGHEIGPGVEVVRHYAPDLPRIEAYAGELNQVWTNIIDNALDAMDGTGTLRVEARPDGTGVVVEIGDTGPGMSPEVARRAFEAFYTTKDVGKGTGLGLDTARRIVVDRHGGTIGVDSRPGETVFRVRLPAGPEGGVGSEVRRS
jgi:signal transduction histidine kinase